MGKKKSHPNPTVADAGPLFAAYPGQDTLPTRAEPETKATGEAPKRLLVMLNPFSGKGSAPGKWAKIAPMLDAKGIEYEVVFVRLE